MAKLGRKSRPKAERFWEKVDKNGPIPENRPELGNCWLWIASTNQYGYGYFENTHAHRLAFELCGGIIPDGLELDHLCRNRRCVRPSHTEPVTRRENILRGVGTAAVNARKTSCIHGHPFDEENTYLRKTGRGCKACGRKRVREYEIRKRNKELAEAAEA